MKRQLLQQIESSETKVCVLGVGYVGLPLLLNIASANFAAIGYDIDQSRIDQLNTGQSGLSHIPNFYDKKLSFTTDIQDAADCSIFVICVPTPLDNGLPDNSYIDKAVATIKSVVKPGCLVSLESTTYPGTTKETVCKALEDLGLVIGTDAFVCFSPEREDPGRKTHDLSTTPKIVGGATIECGDVGRTFYQKFVKSIVRVSSLEVAEASKLIENTYRAVNIALANEFKTIFDILEIDFYEAMDAAATKPYGFAPFFPGPGVGGHCIPIDPFYLTWKTAQTSPNHTPLIDHALEINEKAYLRTIDALSRELLARGKDLLKRPKILLVGASYKTGVEDVRESPFFNILNALLVVGVYVDYLDPLVPTLKHAGTVFRSVREVGLNYDAAIIVTTQPGVDYANLQATMPFIIDSRRSYDKHYDNVIRA